MKARSVTLPLSEPHVPRCVRVSPPPLNIAKGTHGRTPLCRRHADGRSGARRAGRLRTDRGDHSLSPGLLRCDPRFGRRHLLPATAVAQALAELLAFLRGHVLPPLPHPVTPVHGRTRPPTQAAEQNTAQDQQTQRSPQGAPPPAIDLRHPPVPQAHHYHTDDYRSQRGNPHDLESSSHPFALHVSCPHLLVNSS